ncbi:MAG: transcription termination factor NusA [bacterium]|nr:transcription termination factor NusA [bacterium]
MAIIKSEFTLALNQVATERGISPQDVIVSMEAAILAAFKKEHPDIFEESIVVQVSRDTGETKILKEEKNITPPGFGRIAAQTARQVILQKIREAEKKTVISHYKQQVGSLIKGRVIRFDGYNAFIDIGKTEAVLPKEEQMRNEKYTPNASFIFFLKDISEDKFGHSRVVISRSAPQLISELFKREVPEISSGTVEIKKVVREPGERAKIAVFSAQGGVDPVGACVGQKGVRVQTVTNELGGQEKIDIIQWNAEDRIFLISALSPAKIIEVKLDTDKRKAQVIVDESQAPLAIGKGGINVNLASRLTNYEIDIVQTSSTPKVVPVEEKKEEPKN